MALDSIYYTVYEIYYFRLKSVVNTDYTTDRAKWFLVSPHQKMLQINAEDLDEVYAGIYVMYRHSYFTTSIFRKFMTFCKLHVHLSVAHGGTKLG
jgi:hypothetical protein